MGIVIFDDISAKCCIAQVALPSCKHKYPDSLHVLYEHLTQKPVTFSRTGAQTQQAPPQAKNVHTPVPACRSDSRNQKVVSQHADRRIEHAAPIHAAGQQPPIFDARGPGKCTAVTLDALDWYFDGANAGGTATSDCNPVPSGTFVALD